MGREPTRLPLHLRIRALRAARRQSISELAGRVGVSPSYVSLIEAGDRVPDEKVAARLAEALDDDVELYRAWSHARDVGDLRSHLSRMKRLLGVTSSPVLRNRFARGDRLEPEMPPDDEPEEQDAHEPLASMAAASRRRAARSLGSHVRALHPADLSTELTLSAQETAVQVSPDALSENLTGEGPVIAVPLLADGTDPRDDPWSSGRVEETLWLDERLLPPDVDSPFAYRVSAATIERVSGLLAPGEVVVLNATPGSLDAEHVHAVRFGRRIVLTRAVLKGRQLVMLPGGQGKAARGVELIDLLEAGDLEDVVAGTVVAAFRSWPQGNRERSTPDRDPGGHAALTRQGVRGRKPGARAEGDLLVRDCEWKDGYGWRPIQRPEDLDYLEANPGTRIRFRLLRDGRVRYLLEMTPAQWREALGDHVEGSAWRRNGYIVAVTRRRKGEYTEEFQDRWAPWVSEAESGGSSA